MRSPGRNPATACFTLVELLVVLAVIGILAALLLPAVQRGVVRARITKSLSNLEQVGIVEKNYATEHDGAYIQIQGAKTPGHDGAWLSELYYYAYPSAVTFPGYGPGLTGTIFTTPMMEKGTAARGFGMSSDLEANQPSRHYALLSDTAGIALVADVKTSSVLIPSQINPRNNGRANVLFVDGHVDGVVSNAIPASSTDHFWSGKP